MRKIIYFSGVIAVFLVSITLARFIDHSRLSQQQAEQVTICDQKLRGLENQYLSAVRGVGANLNGLPSFAEYNSAATPADRWQAFEQVGSEGWARIKPKIGGNIHQEDLIRGLLNRYRIAREGC